MSLLDLSCGRVCCLCDQPCTISDAAHIQRNGTAHEEDHFCGEIHPCTHDCEMDGHCGIVKDHAGGMVHIQLQSTCVCVCVFCRSLTHLSLSLSLSSVCLSVISAWMTQGEVGIRKKWSVCDIISKCDDNGVWWWWRSPPAHPWCSWISLTRIHTHRTYSCRVILPFRREHDGLHSHTLDESSQTHFCTVRCPACGNMCRKPPGHSGQLHHTQHGPMVNTAILQQHKYRRVYGGTLPTCDSFCSSLGRGHTHLVLCAAVAQDSGASAKVGDERGGQDQSVPTRCPFQHQDDDELSLLTSGRVHRKDTLCKQHPHIDELLHDTYWRHMGFEDPVSDVVDSRQLRAFNRCRVQCRGRHGKNVHEKRDSGGRKRNSSGKNGNGGNHSSGDGSSEDDVVDDDDDDDLSVEEGDCARHVSHRQLDPYSATYLDDIALQSCRFASRRGTLSPTGHHLACEHPFHHYILLDCSKSMLLDDIVPSPSMKIFRDEHHTAALHQAKSYQNRLGAMIELVYRFAQLRHKLSPMDHMTLVLTGCSTSSRSSSAAVPLDNKPVQNYSSIMDLLLSAIKPERKPRYASAVQRLMQVMHVHREEDIRHHRQPLCMLITAGRAPSRRSSTGRDRSSSAFFKTINLAGGVSGSSGTASAVHSVANLLRDMCFHYDEHSHFPQMPKLNIVKLGDRGDDSKLKDMLLYGDTHGKRAVRFVDCTTDAETRPSFLLMEGADRRSRPSIAPQIRVLLAQLLLQFEHECITGGTDADISHNDNHGGLLVRSAIPAVLDQSHGRIWSVKDQRSLAERDKLAKEVLETERNYVWSISKCLEMYYHPLANEWSHIISEQDRRALFSGLLNIYELHKKLLAMLEKRLHKWNLQQRMGDIFLELAPLFKMYTQYTSKYELAMETLRRLSSQLPFKNFMLVRKQDPYAQGHNLTSLLIMPIQRVPRYDMLLRNMLKETPRGHPDHEGIEKAQQQMKKTADYLNNQISERQQQVRMRMIEERVSGISGLIKPNRWFVKDGRMMYSLPLMGTETCVIFLFNDVLLHVSERSGGSMNISGSSSSSSSSGHSLASSMSSSSSSSSSAALRKSRGRSVSHIPGADALADDPLLALSDYATGSGSAASHDGKLYDAKFVFRLHELTVADVPRRNNNAAFQLIRSSGSVSEEQRYMYYCSCEEEKREWMDTISRCIEVAREKKSYFTRQQYLVRIKQDVAMMQMMKSPRF